MAQRHKGARAKGQKGTETQSQKRRKGLSIIVMVKKRVRQDWCLFTGYGFAGTVFSSFSLFPA